MSNKWLPLIFIVGIACLGLGLYSVLSKSTPNISQGATQQTSQGSPKCVVTYPTGSCWTITPPKTKCGSLPTPAPSVSANGDIYTVVVPANVNNISLDKTFQKGDQLEMQATGFVAFSSDHPCAPPEGLNGWYDPYVDGPFKQNVGGVEVSLGAQRYLVGNQRVITVDSPSVPVFRVIERLNGYNDNNSGAFTVIVKKR